MSSSPTAQLAGKNPGPCRRRLIRIFKHCGLMFCDLCPKSISCLDFNMLMEMISVFGDVTLKFVKRIYACFSWRHYYVIFYSVIPYSWVFCECKTYIHMPIWAKIDLQYPIHFFRLWPFWWLSNGLHLLVSQQSIISPNLARKKRTRGLCGWSRKNRAWAARLIAHGARTFLCYFVALTDLYNVENYF